MEACCLSCSRGLSCAGGVCPTRGAVRRSPAWQPTSPLQFIAGASGPGRRHRHPPERTAAGLRDAGALSRADDGGGDVVVDSLDALAAEAGKRRSIARGVALASMRSGDAGDVGDPEFDPSDPASMTEARWASMGTTERRDWINANVRNDADRNRMISGIATGVFDTVRDFVRTERETRLAEIREGASTQREQYRATLDTERARIDGEVRRAQIAADTARADADRQALLARQTTDATERAIREAAAAEARTAAAAAEATAADARGRSAAAEAEAARLRSLEAASAANRGGGWTATHTVVAVGGTLLVAGAVAAVAMSRQAPAPAPQWGGPQFGGGYAAPQFGGGQ